MDMIVSLQHKLEARVAILESYFTISSRVLYDIS